MATSVLIGRKELFAFAERYSSRRLRDYSELADGEVLCRLFSLIFPQLAIRPASAQTHSVTQRTLSNWEALYRGFARLHIPLVLLDPLALARNCPEAGFSTLVLFFFLFHLSKKTDYSVEFAMDVSEELTVFLQSVDSIASLLLGEAVDWGTIPEELGEIIRQQPSFHVSPGEQEALEDAAAKQCRVLLCPASAGTGSTMGGGSLAGSSTNSSTIGRGKPAQRRGHRLAPPGATARKKPAESRTTALSSLSSPDRVEGEPQQQPFPTHRSALATEDDSVSLPPDGHQRQRQQQQQTTTSSPPAAQETEEVANEEHHHHQEHQQQLQQLRRRLIEKAKEAEKLRGTNIQLLSQVASLETELGYAQQRQADAERRADDLAATVEALANELEASHAQVCALAGEEREALAEGKLLQRGTGEAGDDDDDDDGHTDSDSDDPESVEKAIDRLLEDVVDPQTGKPLNAHELANLLHCALLEHMQDAPLNREQAQSWLWSIVTAYHVLESRLVNAVDVIETLQQARDEERQRRRRSRTPSRTQGSLTTQQWEEQHTVEHELRQRCSQQERRFAALVTSAVAREDVWRRLCAAVHEAERLSSAALAVVAESGDEATLTALVSEREAYYHAAEELTEELKQKTLDRNIPSSDGASVDDSACWAMRCMMQKVMVEKAELERQLTELQTRRTAESKPSSQVTERAAPSSYRQYPWQKASDTVALQPSFPAERLTTPLPLSQLVSSSPVLAGSAAASGARTRPKRVEPSRPEFTESRSPLGLSAASPYGKNLEALLAEATSPYDQLLSDRLTV